MTAHARPLLSADTAARQVALSQIAAIEAIQAASNTRGDVTESCDGPDEPMGSDSDGDWLADREERMGERQRWGGAA